jgi:hypothetical protein
VVLPLGDVEYCNTDHLLRPRQKEDVSQQRDSASPRFVLVDPHGRLSNFSDAEITALAERVVAALTGSPSHGEGEAEQSSA